MKTVIIYKHIHQDRDRHGRIRVYFYRRGGRKIRMREELGSEAFTAAYHRLLAAFAAGELAGKTKRPLGPEPGTFEWLCAKWSVSPEFRALDRSTQRTRRNIINGLTAELVRHDSPVTYASFPIERIGLDVLQILRDRKAGRPEAANSRVRALRAIFKWAVEKKLLFDNPSLGLSRVRNTTGGHHTWTTDEVAQYEARHPLGTKPNLALALILYTGARRSDVVRLGRPHLREGWLKFRAHKGRNRNPVTVEIPLLAPLAAAIEAGPCGELTFLATEWGRPFTSDGFGNWFKDQCVAAGLPHCSAHGLRKAAATRAAENGATPHELMSIFGWRSVKEAELYTREAERRRLAASGMPLMLGAVSHRKRR